MTIAARTLLLLILPLVGFSKDSPVTPLTVEAGQWLDLFDGGALGGWEATQEDSFVGAGEVRVKEGAIHLPSGSPYTGITWKGAFPVEDFEIEWEAQRPSGYDIFCGCTVPVGDERVTLVLGGWGDSVVGLSNVDGFNASENESTCMMSFENGTWYRVRLRVDRTHVQAWIDGKLVIQQERDGHEFDIYFQLEPHDPVGFFSWNTHGALRKIRMKRLPEEDAEDAP